ncbi:SSU ribosomal protein S8p (S15Ae) [hydrothermal vent metagenome]|uniref:SSU ribosomal protein S8p (S15Ae) n=1 Tax=hydrothermal vent metagenome TaxID=652676 RepID=A0A3B1E4S4_9ZZZZ
MNDLIADALTRIRNANMRKLSIATLVHSNTVEGVVSVLQQKEYIESFQVVESDKNKKTIKVVLKYDDNENSVITEIKRVSKSGRRVYKNATDLKSFKNGYGTIVVSTNKGIIANDEAVKLNVGGEALCSVW